MSNQHQSERLTCPKCGSVVVKRFEKHAKCERCNYYHRIIKFRDLNSEVRLLDEDKERLAPGVYRKIPYFF